MGVIMLKLLFAIVILSGSISAFAEDTESTVTGTMPAEKESAIKESKLRAGLMTGFNNPKGDIKATTEYGVTTAFQPMGALGFGIDAQNARLDDQNRNRRTTIMVNALLNGDLPVLRHSYAGVGGGPVILNGKVNWGYAPVAGFDIPFNQKAHDFVSLGLTAKYLINPNTPNSLSAAAALKYWF